MTDDLRRRDDVLLADIDKRLALVEQAQAMGDKAADSRWRVVERAIEALTVEVRGFNSALAVSTAEPSGSPAGRAITADIADLRGDLATVAATVDGHDDLIQQSQGAFRLIRVALGTSVIALVASILQIVNALQVPR